MKKIISSVLIVLLLAGTALFFLDRPLFDTLTSPLDVSSCDFPIQYHIGSIDSRFGLSQSEVQADVAEAAAIWSSQYGKKLFAQDPKNGLTVNFVYDARQALNSQINTLQGQIGQEKNNLDPQIQAYNQKSADFKQRVSLLNNEISYWNSQGGAPADEYQKLVSEQQALQQEANDLNAMAKSLNQSTDSFNTQVGQLNQTVNTFNASLRLKPEEGLYVPANNEIDIYFDITHAELIHTLAHELGHSLGLGHNSGNDSIMYPYTNDSVTLSGQDIAALQQVCKPQLFTNLLAQKLAVLINSVMNKNANQQ